MPATPFSPGSLRWPAEWEPHERTWIAWPHQRDDWPGKFEPIPWVYAEIVRQLRQSEPVSILVNDRDTEEAAKSVLTHAGVELGNVTFHHVPTDRVWTRDSGPIFVKTVGGGNLALDWRFNGWAKYSNYAADDRSEE